MDVDYLLDTKLVTEQKYEGFVSLVWTYKGRLRYLDLTNFDLNRWRTFHKNYLCCEDAIPLDCVCDCKTFCEGHGSRCHGSHD